MFDHVWTKVSKTRKTPNWGDLCWLYCDDGTYASFSGQHYVEALEKYPNAVKWRTQYVCPEGNMKANLDAAEERQRSNGQRS